MFKKINWRYALGEIIIVIIGISIAFALNQWAERSKNKTTKAKYLESLIVDLDNEVSHLNENIERFQKNITSVRNLFPYLYGKKGGRDTMYQKVFELANIITFQPNDVTYKTLINSGDLNLFDNFRFKKALEKHYSQHQLIEQDYSRQEHIHTAYFGDFIIYNIDYNKLGNGDYSFMDDRLLANIVQSLYGTFQIAIQSSNDGIERCKLLKNTVEEELNAL